MGAGAATEASAPSGVLMPGRSGSAPALNALSSATTVSNMERMTTSTEAALSPAPRGRGKGARVPMAVLLVVGVLGVGVFVALNLGGAKPAMPAGEAAQMAPTAGVTASSTTIVEGVASSAAVVVAPAPTASAEAMEPAPSSSASASAAVPAVARPRATAGVRPGAESKKPAATTTVVPRLGRD